MCADKGDITMHLSYGPWIKLGESLTREDAALINGLAAECVREDGAALKLELDYKLGASLESAPRASMRAVNELMYFDGDALIGYIGINSFGGAGSPPELNGMVHPGYRRRGVFQMLSSLAIGECRRQKVKSALLLCGRQSAGGQKFIEKTGARYHHSEFEMYLRKEPPKHQEGSCAEVSFRKATNQDAREVARHNAIYFGEERNEEYRPSPDRLEDPGLLLPEEEEKKGMTIYFAEFGGKVVGKVHLQLIAGIGGIYGLGVLPEFRGRGFGRAVLLGAVDKLKDAGAKEIMLQVATGNANALRLYESCGFKTTSTMDYFELSL
jgi:ribosomal protein S18 acetylase RimI-like enzyme